MGLQHRERPLHGVQFHPESVDSEYGEEIIANFLGITPALRWSELEVELDTEGLFLRAFAESPYSFWLDSSRTAYGMGRYSYLGACAGDGLEVLRAYAGADVVERETHEAMERLSGTVFEHLRAGLATTPWRPAPRPYRSRAATSATSATASRGASASAVRAAASGRTRSCCASTASWPTTTRPTGAT